ncbi:MAG: substrate-binding domain-containing protein [Nitrospinaceae bacterium]
MGRIGKLLLMFLIISVPSFAAGKPIIKYEGSSTVGLFIRDAAKVYKKADIEISVLTESNGGEICPLAKTCGIGGVAREIHPLFVNRGLYAIPFAYDVLTAIVNSENPVKQLSSDQLEGIFSGKIKNWKEVGGENKPITVYIVGKESATRDVFKKHILKDSEYGVYSRVTRPDWRIVLSVDLDKNGIGHTSYSFAATTDHVRPLIIDEKDPLDHQSKYPIRRVLYLTTYGPPQGAEREFLDWVLSDKGREVIKKRFAPLH